MAIKHIPNENIFIVLSSISSYTLLIIGAMGVCEINNNDLTPE